MIFFKNWPRSSWVKNTQTANAGLVSSVGRAPARQSGRRRFKSRSRQCLFVYPKFNFNVVKFRTYCTVGKQSFTVLSKSFGELQ